MAHQINSLSTSKPATATFGHEFLSAYTRPGPYGGLSSETAPVLAADNRADSARVSRLTDRRPGVDSTPSSPDPAKTGGGKFGPGIADPFTTPMPDSAATATIPSRSTLEEPIRLLEMLRDECGVAAVNLTAGSPYYNPHIQRPVFYLALRRLPAAGGPAHRLPRQIDTAHRLKQAAGLPPSAPPTPISRTSCPTWPSPSHELDRPAVARRLVLSYWELPADTLEGRPLQTKRICRTFSDCTTGPRNGLISGCYPLDDHYKEAPEAERLKQAKSDLRKRLAKQ